MSAPSSGRKTPVDYGVQIRFINDLCDTGQPGSQPKTKTQSKYGVAVRVQGIDGQPYVVLKDGEKGDSYGVQLRTHYPSGYSSLPRRRERAEPGTPGADVGGGSNEDFQLSRPPGDGKSGSYGNLDGGLGVRGEREQPQRVSGREGGMERNMWHGSYQEGLNGSLGSVRSSQSYPNPPPQTSGFHSNQRQAAVNRLVNRFDDGNTRAQQTDLLPPQQDPRATSPVLTHNPYTSPPQGTVTKFPGQSFSDLCLKVTPDLLLDQGQSAEMSSEEEQAMQMIYNILRQGTHIRTEENGKGHGTIVCESGVRVGMTKPLCFQAHTPHSFMNKQLLYLIHMAKQVWHSHFSVYSHGLFSRRLTQLRMDRENAEARVREMEDQLAELQDELRRENVSTVHSLCLQDLMSCQAQLMEVCQLKHKLEETLRQRERELTALKGALKEEVATHDKEIEVLREQYSTDMEKLRSSMEQVSQSHAGIEAERLRVNASVRTLQQQLEDCRDESSHWMEQFHATRDELRTTKQDKQKQLYTTTATHVNNKKNHSQIVHVSVQELQRCNADLQKAKSEVDKHRTEFDKKVMEVISLKKSHQNQEAELKYEIDRLKDQLQRAKEDFELEASKTHLSRAQMDFKLLQDTEQEQKEANTRLKEKLSRLEVMFSETELTLHSEVRGLRSELDEAKRKASRLSQEHRELSLRLEDIEKDKEALKQTISQLEDTKRQQERALEKINKEYESLAMSSREEVQALRVQLEEQRERARKEMHEVQRHGNDAQTELERSHVNLRRLEEEVCMSRQKKELLLVCEERDNHQLDKELLTNRLRHLEGEMEASKNNLNEKTREVRILEDKLKRMELELEEEKSSVEMLTDRMARSRDQIDQLRSELMQERSSKQDLELDKNAMERHLKELRSRVADMEGQSRSSAGVSQLENKIQELEERLRSEEREKNSVLASQRRLERKLKELNMTLDEERQTQTEQRDQLTLRVKALKRQVDEGETELERIDGLRRKAQRDMEEQMELKEALQARVTALEAELKRKTQAAMRPALDSSALSSDDDDSLYDPSTITSILTESNLQTSSC
uniref:Cingulin n=1 Tax=Lates calcarifer TaxID=8187 RepID=A0A4W6FU39_LATCA